MKNNLFIILSFALIANWGNAQQLEATNLYEFNKLKLNPAYAGESGCGDVHIGHLGQWAGFDGAPQTSYVNGSAVIAKNMALGGKVTLDRLGSLTRFNAQAVYSYKLNFGEMHNLRLGLGAGVNQHSFDFSGSTIGVETDASLVRGREKGMSFYSEVGLVYSLKNFQLSFSVPNLIETSSSLSPSISGELTNSRHMVGYMGYRFGKPQKITLTPSVLYKNGSAGQYQLEGNLMMDIKRIFQLGVGYRHEAGLLGRLGFNINDKIQVAYAYEFAMTDLAKASSGSHEILIGLNLCGKGAKKVPTMPITDNIATPIADTVYVESPPVVDTVIIEKLIEEEVVKMEHTIYYEQSQNILDTDKEKEALSKIVDYLKENNDKSIYIKGYASEEGTDYANFKLSGERVKNVYSYLLGQGVNRSQMVSIVQGEVAEYHGADQNEKDTENRKVIISLK